MKMTRLEWRYLQKIALDHPYFDTHELPLTEKEADAIVKANIRMTGKEFVDSIYAQLGMTRPSEEKKPFAWLRSIGDQFTIPPIRKIIISVLVVLLLTVFFAATPMGQAIAESVIQYIVTLFNDGRIVINRSNSDTSLVFTEDEAISVGNDQQKIDSSVIYVSSFEEFTRMTGKNPVELPLSCSKLYYEYDEYIDYLEFHAMYEVPDGMIITYQIWDAEDLISSTATGYLAYDVEASIFYSVEEDGTIIIKWILEDSVLGINARGDFALRDLIDLMKAE